MIVALQHDKRRRVTALKTLGLLDPEGILLLALFFSLSLLLLDVRSDSAGED